jgi:hypothetical protein
MVFVGTDGRVGSISLLSGFWFLDSVLWSGTLPPYRVALGALWLQG